MKCPSLEALVEISLIPRNSILRQLPYLRPGSLNLISSFHHWWNSSYCSRCSVFLPTWVSIQKSKVSYNPLYIHESIELTGFLHVSWSKHRMNVVRSFNPWCGKMTIPTFHQSHRTWLTPWQEKKRTLLHQSFHWEWLPCLEETHLDSGRKQPSSWKDCKDRKVLSSHPRMLGCNHQEATNDFGSHQGCWANPEPISGGTDRKPRLKSTGKCCSFCSKNHRGGPYYVTLIHGKAQEMLQTIRQEDWIVGEVVSIQWDIFQQNLAMFRTQNVTTHCSGLWTGLLIPDDDFVSQDARSFRARWSSNKKRKDFEWLKTSTFTNITWLYTNIYI